MNWRALLGGIVVLRTILSVFLNKEIKELESEEKSVEFGAKVNNIQIDGISFIEHLSFKAFNEGIRLKDCIRMQQKL